MSELSVPISSAQTTVEAPEKRRRSWLNFDNRFLAPLFITCILLAGQLSFGILESYENETGFYTPDICFQDAQK